jgi:hypothetical protein
VRFALSKFLLEPKHWYAWQMVPGYTSDRVLPYFSPIYVWSTRALNTGPRKLALRFLNAQYAEGVQAVELDLRIVIHAQDYLVAEILHNEEARTAIVSRVGFDWIRRFCPEVWDAHPPRSLDEGNVPQYLNAIYSLPG